VLEIVSRLVDRSLLGLDEADGRHATACSSRSVTMRWSVFARPTTKRPFATGTSPSVSSIRGAIGALR
jgi:hypothetical protein